MTPQQAFDHLEQAVIMAGMRGHFPPPVALNLAEVFLDEGISTFEFTMNSEQPIEAMVAVKKQYGDRVMAGMGTVLDVETARRVIDAGADFIVSPAFQPEVVEFVMKHDVFMVPGVITPSECVNAWGMGVKLLKLFPIGALGLDYFKAIYGPLSHMKFMMNGAMNAENGAQFLQAGAMALGMAGWLTGDGTWTESRLRSRAHLIMNAVQAARGGLVQQA
ncbi:MAG: bifunctional 4-hydroxy-2-oxoglutarate aldolase/2-dehydro-3-deoxy-phosphogluconate aldolase [Anaerolineae bacterium]